MKFLRAICRVIVGVVFIVSGFLKAADPVGTALKINDYLVSFGLQNIGSAALWCAAALCLAEFMVGVSILKGLKFRFFSSMALLFSLFFTIVTFVSAMFDMVGDCGCFGDALHLTPWQSFYKNAILLPCSILLYVQRDKFVPIANKFWEAVYLSGYALFIIGISYYSVRHLPPADFTDFRPGRDLLSQTADLKYNTVFVYSKNGKDMQFDIDNLPDSSWKYVSSKTTLAEGDEQAASKMQFILKDEAGNVVTDSVLNSRNPVVISSFYDENGVDVQELGKIKETGDSLVSCRCADFYLVSAMSREKTMRMLSPVLQLVSYENQSNIFENSKADSVLPFKILYADFKIPVTLNRSNGGLTYIKDGEVIRKWSVKDFSHKAVISSFNENPEKVVAKEHINSQLFLEISIAIIICMVVILRFISKALYKTVKSGLDI